MGCILLRAARRRQPAEKRVWTIAAQGMPCHVTLTVHFICLVRFLLLGHPKAVFLLLRLFTHTHTRLHTLTLTHSLTHTLTHSHTPSLTHPHTHTLTHSLIHSHTLSLTLTQSHTHTHTHSHSPPPPPSLLPCSMQCLDRVVDETGMQGIMLTCFKGQFEGWTPTTAGGGDIMCACSPPPSPMPTDLLLCCCFAV